MKSLSLDARDTFNYIRRASIAEQGGILSHVDPTAFNPANPLRLWIIQLAIIIFTTQALGLLLKRIRQPRVIAEVIGGIILGPTVMGRIPGFSNHIFPKESLPFLSLVANIGLVLFLFIVGLEIDINIIKQNRRNSLLIGIGGIIIPFSVGAGMSKAIYDNFVNKDAIPYNHFLVFVCVSYSITAFPVLCRILTELKLLDSKVGVCVLSAGVGNDILGWTLLALVVALVNASTGLTALYIVLCAAGWACFMLFPVRFALLWFARKSGSTQNGPSTLFMTIIIMTVFASAFFTDIIGVHAIFGGFLAGLCVPREGGLAISLTEKFEDMITIVFLPLYFTLSGLSTNLGLLNTGKVWGFIIAIVVTDWSAKFTGASTAARIAGLKWRECFTVGTFMSCKGLVELVVLNIGLQAGLLETQLFSMFVLNALVLTFLTTPVALAFYPPHLRVKYSDTKANLESAPGTGGAGSGPPGSQPQKSNFLVVLDKFENLPAVMSISQLLWSTGSSSSSSTTSIPDHPHTSPGGPTTTKFDAVRIMELTERTSTVMKSSNTEALAFTDELLRVFKSYAQFAGVGVKSYLKIVDVPSFGEAVNEHANENGNDMTIMSQVVSVPLGGADHWTSKAAGESVVVATAPSGLSHGLSQSDVIRSIFLRSTVDVGLFLDRHELVPTTSWTGGRKIFMPFFGGWDDQVALNFVIQLCGSGRVEAVVVRFVGAASEDALTAVSRPSQEVEEKEEDIQKSGYPDTVYHQSTALALQSKMADDLLWESCISPSSSALALGTFKNIRFETRETSQPLHAMLSSAKEETKLAIESHTRLITVLGRARRQPNELMEVELEEVMKNRCGVSTISAGTGHGSVGEMKKTVGNPASGVILEAIDTDILVVQAAYRSE